jgi:hypothetical protein
MSDGKPFDILAHGDYIARQLVPENGWGDDHSRVVSAPEYLDVGAAGQRHLYSDKDVSAMNCRNGYRLNLQVLLAVKHGSHHVAIHL